MNVGDTVVLKTEKVKEIKDPGVRAIYAGEGVITRDFSSGYYMVRFTNLRTGESLAGGAYGDDLVVVKKAECFCNSCFEDLVAPDGSI